MMVLVWILLHHLSSPLVFPFKRKRFLVFPKPAVAYCTQRADQGTAMGHAPAFFDMEKRLCISLDPHLITQSSEQSFKIPPWCHCFEKEWIECTHGIGIIWAQKEYRIVYEDFKECFLWYKNDDMCDKVAAG